MRSEWRVGWGSRIRRARHQRTSQDEPTRSVSGFHTAGELLRSSRTAGGFGRNVANFGTTQVHVATAAGDGRGAKSQLQWGLERRPASSFFFSPVPQQPLRFCCVYKVGACQESVTATSPGQKPSGDQCTGVPIWARTAVFTKGQKAVYR